VQCLEVWLRCSGFNDYGGSRRLDLRKQNLEIGREEKPLTDNTTRER